MAGILLIEPDQTLAAAYSKSLGAAGHQVHRQTDAQAALHILDDHQIDLIILEIQLTGHNGVEFLYELRSYPDWDNIPVVLHTMVQSTHAGLGRAFWTELGIAGYYYKPRTSLAQLTDCAQRYASPQKTA